MDLTIITTCKCRRHHVEQALPTWLAQRTDVDYAVLVVDYGDPDHVGAWAPTVDKRVSSVRVLDGTSVFHPSRARNIGGRFATGKFLAFVDGDVLLAPTFITDVLSRLADTGASLATCTSEKEVTGTCVVTSEAFHAVRGYGEDLVDWGYQDHDFYNRVEAACGARVRYPETLVVALPNTRSERVGAYANHRPGYTGSRNKKIAERRGQNVNPDGYGVCACRRTQA